MTTVRTWTFINRCSDSVLVNSEHPPAKRFCWLRGCLYVYQLLKLMIPRFLHSIIVKIITLLVGPHDCVVSVPRDGNHMPIPLVTSSAGEPTVIYPDENGKFIIRHESYLNMSCAGSKFTSPSRVVLENVVATCLKGMLMYEGKKYDFDQFKCSRNPKPTLSVTRHICQRMTDRIIEVGFKTGFGFIVLYKVCFDTVFKSTLYTWHVVNPPLNNFRQNSVVEPTLINPYLKDDDVEEEYQKMVST